MSSMVGIYASAFDPIHIGHLQFARQAIAACGLEKVYFYPEPSPAYRQGVRGLEHRMKMVRLAIAGDPQLGLLDANQSQATLPEAAVQASRQLPGKQLAVIISNAAVHRLTSWPQKLFERQSQNFIIGTAARDMEKVQHSLRLLEETRGLSIPYELLRLPAPEMGAVVKTALRSGKPHPGVPVEVLGYIAAQRLYASSGRE